MNHNLIFLSIQQSAILWVLFTRECQRLLCIEQQNEMICGFHAYNTPHFRDICHLLKTIRDNPVHVEIESKILSSCF